MSSSRWDMLALGLVRLGVSGALLFAGFYAVSDDDFSRVVIAQRFAATPRLDASGTSWLPLPFWITGTAMAALGRSLDVARGVALASSVVSVVLVHRAALWLGVSRGAAFLSAAVTALLPTAAHLGASFQPEVLTAGLVVLGAAGGAAREGAEGAAPVHGKRWLGALALAAACLCRYEAWPAALVFAAVALRSALRTEPAAGTAPGRPALASLSAFGPPLLALSTPALWMLHGALAHGSPIFFLHRVAAFRRALGESEPWTAALSAYPRALFAEPELVLAVLAIFAGTYQAHRLRRARQPGTLDPERARAHGRFALVLFGVIAFLMAGRMLDGAPTHHPERTLLPAWFGLAVLGADAAARLPRLPVTLGLLATTGLGLGLRHLGPGASFAPRSDELAIGNVAREHVPGDARLAIDTPDYGYFAVMAAFRAPERATPTAARDPRLPQDPGAFDSADRLEARLRELDATWLVVERTRWEVALRVGEPVAVRGRYVLLRVLR